MGSTGRINLVGRLSKVMFVANFHPLDHNKTLSPTKTVGLPSLPENDTTTGNKLIKIVFKVLCSENRKEIL